MRALLLATALIVSLATTAHAQTSPISSDTAVPQPRGPYNIAADNNIVWRIDQSTGLISYCLRDTVSNDPGLIAQRPPLCSAWGR